MKLVLSILLSALAFTASAQLPTYDANPARTVYIKGVIDASTEHIPNDIIKLTALNHKPIFIVFDSPGGSVFYGQQILGAIEMARAQGVVFKCLVTRQAASMAFILYNECDEHYLLPHSIVLWHSVRTFLFGVYTPRKLQVIVEDLERWSQDFDVRIAKKLAITYDKFMYYYTNELYVHASTLIRMAPDYAHIVYRVTGVEGPLYGY